MQTTTIRISTTSYPKRKLTYQSWCKKFKVSTRAPKHINNFFYKENEYDYSKLIKIINQLNEHGKIGTKSQSKFGQKCSSFSLLCKRKVQKAFYKIIFA
jgi:HD-like signal output (HDOD) protein